VFELSLKHIFFKNTSKSGLPDGLFSNQKSKHGQILEGLRLLNVHIFYGYWEYLTDLLFYDRFLHFSGFSIMYLEKSGNPALSTYVFTTFIFTTCIYCSIWAELWIERFWDGTVRETSDSLRKKVSRQAFQNLRHKLDFFSGEI
jgi:hypothetical protein